MLLPIAISFSYYCMYLNPDSSDSIDRNAVKIYS